MSPQNSPNPADKVIEVRGVKIYNGKANVDRIGLRDAADDLRSQIRMNSGVIVLGWRSEGKVVLVASVSKDLTDRLDAVKILTEAGVYVGSQVCGQKDYAEAEGSEPGRLAQSLKAIPAIIEKMLH